MIISKTPIRISFFGGGTDYPDYYRKHSGEALSTSIDKYIYITVKKMESISEFKYKINYSKLEACNSIDEIQHPVVKACIKFLEIEESIEIHVISDLPAKSGTGSSSTFTVGLLHALHCLKGRAVSKERLSKEAIHIEQVVLNERVGVQDQLAAAFGGLNHLTFKEDDTLNVDKIIINKEIKERLDNNLLMFYTGVSRFAHQVLEEQIEKTKNQTINNDLEQIKKMVQTGISYLNNDKLLEFGKLLDQAWQKKKMLSNSISSIFLDEIYNKAIDAGAIGGKLLGAGGGGFFVFYVEDAKKKDVRKSLCDYKEVKFNFENDGSRIIFNNY